VAVEEGPVAVEEGPVAVEEGPVAVEEGPVEEGPVAVEEGPAAESLVVEGPVTDGDLGTPQPSLPTVTMGLVSLTSPARGVMRLFGRRST
jgi:hypothetical protein